MNQTNQGKVIGNIVGGDTRKTYGIHQVPQLAVASSAQKIIYRRQMDTPDTAGQHHGAHHIYSKQFISFSSAVVDPFLPARANVLENLSLHRQARSKSKFIAQQ